MKLGYVVVLICTVTTQLLSMVVGLPDMIITNSLYISGLSQIIETDRSMALVSQNKSLSMRVVHIKYRIMLGDITQPNS